MIQGRVWMPPVAADTIQCRGHGSSSCWIGIRSGDIYSIEDWHIQYLNDKLQWPSATSIRCLRCTILYVVSELLGNVIDPSNPSFNPKFKDILTAMCKTPVREELHKIIREECSDPNGPISPGTGASSP